MTTEQELIDAVRDFPTLSIKEIAGRLGVKRAHVYYVLAKANIPPARLSTPEKRARDDEIVAACLRDPVPTLAALGKEFGMTRQRIQQILANARAGKLSLRGRKGVARGHSPRVLERAAVKDAKREQKRAALEDRVRAVRHMRGAGAKWAEIGRALWPHCASPAVHAIQFSVYHGLTDVMTRARKQG